MTKSLAELRAEPPKARPTRSVPICLAPNLVAELQELIEELDTLPTVETDEDGVTRNADGTARKMAQGEAPHAVAVRARMAELLDEMSEHEGDMRLQAGDEGVWRRWVNAHPAREEDEPGHQRDLQVAGGYCNADDLIETLGTYAHSWNGDPLAAGDWDAIFKDNISGPDKKKLAENVIAMYESRLDFRQWRSGLSDSLRKLNASDSLGIYGSVPAVFTAGNPQSSSEASTETVTESP